MTRPRATLLQLVLFAALVALAAAHVARGAEEGVTRVRVDLDLEQLGLVGEGAGDRVVELEIHCQGAEPSHQVYFEDGVLVVRTEAAPAGTAPDPRFGVAEQTGVSISVDLAEELQPELAEPVDEPMEVTWLEPPQESPAAQEQPCRLYEPTSADQLGMPGREPAPAPATSAAEPQTTFVIDDPSATAEVMAALSAALDEAHEESRQRLRDEGYVEEYLGDSGLDEGSAGQQTSSWTVERRD